jgi:predicted HAD superfamily Cof-like phosphohydrolase
MIRQQAQVAAFMQLFEQDTPSLPTVPSDTTMRLRLELIQEELRELSEAFRVTPGEQITACTGNPDLTEIADAIGDLLYVVYGTAVACGIDIGPVFEEIQRSNMSKEWKEGPRIQRSETGKVLKPPTYSPADIKPILEAQKPINYRLPFLRLRLGEFPADSIDRAFAVEARVAYGENTTTPAMCHRMIETELNWAENSTAHAPTPEFAHGFILGLKQASCLIKVSMELDQALSE